MVLRGPPPFKKPTRFQNWVNLGSTCTALPRGGGVGGGVDGRVGVQGVAAQVEIESKF